MPLYEYTCTKCEHQFETLVFDGDKPRCPECDSLKLERMLSLPGLAKVTSGPSGGGCGDLSLPPCGAVGCRRTGKG